MSEIKYLVGDATRPEIPEDEGGIICHICNDIGGWGRGFVMALSKRWPDPEDMYRRWHNGEFEKDGLTFALGNVQVIEVEDSMYVANMVAQHNVVWAGDIPPIRYDRVRQCLLKVAKACEKLDASVHMPRIGAGLAGGTWQAIEAIIKETLIKKNIDVYIYDLPEEDQN